MISLTDEQRCHVMELAAPIPIEQRDEFLRELAGELQLHCADDVGSGALHRWPALTRVRAGALRA